MGVQKYSSAQLSQMRAKWRDLFPADNSGKGIICPFCGSGSGTHGTGISEFGDHKLKCFGCGFCGDIFDIVCKTNGWHIKLDFNKAVEYVAARCGITPDTKVEQTVEQKPTTQNTPPDFSDFIARAQTRLEQTDYWKARGLSLDVCKKFNIGFEPKWQHPKFAGKQFAVSPRLIIPFGNGGYLARDTRNIDQIPEAARRYVKQNAGKVSVFNAEAVGKFDIIIALEGAFDALSLIELGFDNAIACHSISNVNKCSALIDQTKQKPKAFAVAFDNEDAVPVKQAKDKFRRELQKRNIAFFDATFLAGTFKDVNERFLSEREALRGDATKLIEDIQAELEQIRPEAHITSPSTKNVSPSEIAFTREEIPSCPIDLQIPVDFIFYTEGIFFIDKDCAAARTPIVPTRIIQNSVTGKRKVELAVFDRRQWFTIQTDFENIANQNSLLTLTNFGIATYSGATKYLAKFLVDIIYDNADKIPVVLEFDQPGWYDDFRHFRLPYTSDQFMGNLEDLFRQSGSLDDWIEYAWKIRRSPLAAIALAASFAAPLLRILNSRSFALYYYGTSLAGKSASMAFAVSVWGNPSQLKTSFNSTSVGIEMQAVTMNDLPLYIDERQSKARFLDTGNLIYSLINEETKGRGTIENHEVRLRKKQYWKTIILANGEQRLFDEHTTAGAFNRALEIELVESDRIFQNEEQARDVHRFVSQHYGRAGQKYIEYLIALRAEDRLDEIQFAFDDFFNMLKQNAQADYQLEHLSHAAILMTADYLASCAVFGADSESAKALARQDAFDRIGKPILDRLPEKAEIDDAARAFKFIRDWIDIYLFNFYGAHLTSIDDDGKRKTIEPRNPVLGKRFYKKVERTVTDEEGNTVKRPVEVFDKVSIYPEALRDALKKAGFDPKRCLSDFRSRGWLEIDENGQFPVVRIEKGGKPKRPVTIKAERLAEV